MLSLMGSWMQMTAQSWLLWRLTGSELLLGFLGFAQMGPVLLLGIFGGLVADRFPRKKLLLFTQSMALVQAATLAFLAFTGLITPLHILILAAFLGTINAFDMTARQTFLGDMVGMSDVGNAIALNSFLFNMARVVAPPVAGFIVSLYGEGPCFAINAVSFLFVLIALAMMDIGHRSERPGSTILASLREAVSYVRGEATTFRLVLLLSATSLALLPYAYFLPYFADKVLGGKAEMLGTLLASAGLGALVGALLMAREREVSRLPLILGVSSLVLCADLALFSLSRSQFLSSALLFGAGLCTMLAASSANIFLQTTAPERLRGRVISFYVTAFVGFPPLGGFFIGNLAERYGTQRVLLWCALATAAASTLYLLGKKRKTCQLSGL